MKRLWSTILTIIMLAVLVPPAYVNAAQGIEITDVMYTDADGATYDDLYSFGDSITYKIKYNSDVESSVYVLMAYYNDKKMISAIEKTETVNSGEGTIIGTEYLKINDKLEGIYSVKLFIFDSKENMQLINNGSHSLNVENLYSKDLWYVDKNWYGATLTDDFVSSEWDGDEGKRQYGPFSFDYSCLFANYKGGSAPLPLKTGEEKKFGSYALKIENAGEEDGLAPGYPSGTVIIDHIVENGAGTYKLVLFAKTAVSQANIQMGSRLIYDGQVKYDYQSRIATRDWNKFEYDLNITQEQYDKISADPARDIALIFKMDSGVDKQALYLDKISFHKTNLPRNDFETPENVIVRSNAAPGEYVTVVGMQNENIKFISMDKADANGICESAISYDGSLNEVKVSVISKDDTAEKYLTHSILNNGIRYLDFTYFQGSTAEVCFNSIKQNNVDNPYHMMTLDEGAVTFSAKFNENPSGVFVGVSYQDEVMIDYDTADISNNIAEISLFGGNNVTLFCVNSLSDMKLVSDVYTLDTQKLSENKVDFTNSSIGNTTQKFNPVDGTIDVESDGSGTQVVVVKPAGSDEIAYIGVGELNKTLKCKINEEIYSSDGDYDIYLSDANSESTKTEGSVTYVTSDTLRNVYNVLSGDNVTEADVDSVITADVLQIDLTDYNRITDENAKRRARELFVEFKPDTIDEVAKIQEVLDISTGVVLLSQNADINYLKKYGESSNLDSLILAELLESEESALTTEVINLMIRNKLSPEKISTENLNSIFKDAYITAHFNVVAKTYGDIMKYMTDTYKDAIGTDLSRLINVNEPADVYKSMITIKNYINTRAIKAKFDELTEKTNAPQGGGGSGSGGGSSSGGGSGGSSGKHYGNSTGMVIVSDMDKIQTTEAVFDDVSIDHWAYDCIAKLTSKKVIAKADTFRPNDSITREEYVKMIVCTFAEENDAVSTTFSDVDASAWYAKYIQAALDKEWVSGISNSEFGIGKNITREDAVVILFRVLQVETDGKSNPEFSDNGQIADYAKEAVAEAVKMGIISGYEDNSFRPKNSITRAESAKIIDQVMKIKGM